MTDLFVNPWSMAAGAALVSSPVIIHLINRMRFKRVRWAAMEFLLKAQKRMRRKMILEQLLLLLLRILLVLLIGLLVGRFLGFSPLMGTESRTTTHVVVLDDTPSMSDGWRGGEGGAPTDAFEQAKRVLVEQIAPAAAQATTPQTLDLIRLSDLAGQPRGFGRLNAQSIEELKTYLGGFKTQPVRVPLAAGLKKAKDVLAAQGGQDVAQVVHVVSDFRANEWTEDADAIKQAVAELTAAGAKVHLIDAVGDPFRKDEKRPPLAHDNVGIVELRPSKLAVARYEPLEFTLRVRNHGAAELKDVRFSVRVNGDENKGGRSVVVPTLPGNQERAVKFDLTFDRLGTDERPFERFSLVTAVMETPEPGGIAADNVRHAVVDVRERLPILAVEGRPGQRDKKDGDGFYLKPIFTSVLGGFAWVNGSPQDLEKADLRNYSCVLLMNVPALSDAAAANLDRYVRGGGGVGFFLGPDVNASEYNRLLYADGNGVFPVPLPERPTEPLKEDQRLARLFTLQKKVLLKDPAAKTHPALSGIYTDERGQPIKDDDYEKFFSFVVVNQYWPVKRLGKWRDDRAVTELYCMPNEQPMADFEAPARKVADGLPVDDPEFGKFKEVLTPLRDNLKRTAASSEPLYKLAALLDRLLSDQRGEGDQSEALLREFWGHPKVAQVKAEATRLRDAVKFGDPLYVAKQLGRGRVTLLTTTGGEQWSDWPTGPGRPSFVPLVIEMERYLSGGGSDENRTVGTPIDYRVEAARYKPAVRRAFLSHDPTKPPQPGTDASPAPLTDLKEQAMTADGDHLDLKFTEDANPGAYLFGFTSVKPQGTPGDAAEVAEYRAAAVNVDAVREGDLRRAAQDDVLQVAAGAQLHSPDDAGWLDQLKNKKTDLSESGWLFLLILGVLVAEQAMAVRLSFHASPGELDHTAPSAAAVAHRHWGHHAGEATAAS